MDRYARFKDDTGRVFYAAVEGKNALPLTGEPWLGGKRIGTVVPVAGLQPLAPAEPAKIVCVGLNYLDHIAEFNNEAPSEPVIFLKPPTSVIGPGADIIYPEGVGRLDFEAELAVIVGGKARMVGEAQAQDYVFGYTCANDVTARDLQRKDGQWTRAKSFDTFCPLGPYIVSGLDPGRLRIEARLNGQTRQCSSTGRMLFNPFHLLSFVSRIMTLLPGDVILTGTPSGVGPMQPGDKIEVEIENIGNLMNMVAR
ncbi:MAG: fumarylacetoacetate hydrolase family protein [Bacillota bacterium]|uniref:fumarylacetoacetate hydrolase family protein n=1 Tax=Desulforudis sp. DRI-14 TaxID=3459793 RepID=UPI00348B399B